MAIPKLIIAKTYTTNHRTTKMFEAGQNTIRCAFDGKNRLINWVRKSPYGKSAKGVVTYKTSSVQKIKTTKVFTPKQKTEIVATYSTNSKAYDVKRDKIFTLDSITKKVTDLTTGISETFKIK